MAALSFRGSAETVIEFVGFCLNSILFQRGLYQADAFERVRRYGLELYVVRAGELRKYLGDVLTQLGKWFMHGQARQVVVSVSCPSVPVVERWTFNLAEASVREQVEAVLREELAELLRQITASVSFLPVLLQDCSFDITVHTTSDARVPLHWTESQLQHFEASQSVKLRSINTKLHKLEASVAYVRN